MKRTKVPVLQAQRIADYEMQVAKLQTLQTVTSRAQLMSSMGRSYGDARDLYEALGYKTVLTYVDYYSQYLRQDMAKAVINRPVEATWQGDVELVESDDDEETAFEKAWDDLYTDLKLKSKFIRLDKLTGLGKYGALLLGFDDVKQTGDFQQPVEQGKRKLLYVKPLGEGSADIQSWEEDTTNERYGMPTIYNVTIATLSDGTTTTFLVHHSRILHVPGELLESESEGLPRLEGVFNRLTDLEKIVGGSGEMFWRGARPGYQGKVDADYQMTSETQDGLQAQINEYEHNLRRILVNEGVELSSLAMQVADPSKHVDVQVQMISAETGIPKRVLTGSERGELASSEDKGAWLTTVQNRRNEYAEPQIVREFVDICVMYGILPQPGADGYTIKWSDLFAPSEQEKAEVGKTRSGALKEYGTNPVNTSIIPPDAFMKFFLGFSDEEIELINEMRDAAELEEEEDFAGIEEEDVIETEDEPFRRTA